MRKEYERREKAIEVKKKVEYSKQLNESRLKVLQAREDAVGLVLKDAQKSLSTLSGNQEGYQELLLNLIVQGLKKLGEQKALVRCREIDTSLVQSLLPKAVQLFVGKYGAPVPEISLDEAHHLPPPPSQMQKNNDFDEILSCSGGVVVTSADGKVVCSNTLDDRLKIAHAANLPVIRAKLFCEE